MKRFFAEDRFVKIEQVRSLFDASMRKIAPAIGHGCGFSDKGEQQQESKTDFFHMISMSQQQELAQKTKARDEKPDFAASFRRLTIRSTWPLRPNERL